MTLCYNIILCSKNKLNKRLTLLFRVKYKLHVFILK